MVPITPAPRGEMVDQVRSLRMTLIKYEDTHMSTCLSVNVYIKASVSLRVLASGGSQALDNSLAL
jgi:hypothetical protein